MNRVLINWCAALLAAIGIGLLVAGSFLTNIEEGIRAARAVSAAGSAPSLESEDRDRKHAKVIGTMYCCTGWLVLASSIVVFSKRSP